MSNNEFTMADAVRAVRSGQAMSEPMAGTVTITLGDYEKLKAEAEYRQNYLSKDSPEYADLKRKADNATAAYKECESIRQQMTAFQIDADKWRYAMKELGRNDNGIVADAKLGAMVRKMPENTMVGRSFSKWWFIRCFPHALDSSTGADTPEEILQAYIKE